MDDCVNNNVNHNTFNKSKEKSNVFGKLIFLIFTWLDSMKKTNLFVI